MPGNGLCLLHWAAPAGSSYASALFTGWISWVIDSVPGIDPSGAGVWVPAWDPDLGCHVLARGEARAEACNDAIEAAFDGLAGAYEDLCWSVPGGPVSQVPSPGPPQGQPPVLSFSDWVATTHATPESDPCVPCVGSFLGPSLAIDLSQSSALAPGVWLDSVFLRVGSDFYPVALSPAQIAAIEAGTLSEVTLAGWAPLVSAGGKPSLWHQLKSHPAATCPGPSCYWTSTPVLLKP
jgi:hypothetical protein